MKKYRVVKAYNRMGTTVPVGTIITILSGPFVDSDQTAFSLGALEEVKAWEPKYGESVWFADPYYKELYQRTYYGNADSERLTEGLIYPTREQAEECRKRMLEAARKYKEEVLG